jgi:predicted kinase
MDRLAGRLLYWNSPTEEKPVLVIMSGLPATGKTTIARELARRLPAAHLRIDTVEQAVVDAGLAEHPVGVIGYSTCHRIAKDQLRTGLSVIADSVNPLAVTREGWHATAQETGSEYLDVEVICSDLQQHQERAETRTVDIPGLKPPDWQAIQSREYEEWKSDRLVLDTALLDSEACVRQVLDAVAGR